MNRGAMLVVFGLTGLSREATAQTVVPDQGDRIRVKVCERNGGASCRPLVGSFVAWTQDRIVLRDSMGLERQIAAGPRSVLEVSRGKYSPWARGLLYGFLGGVGVGAVATLACRADVGASEDIGLCYAWMPLLAGTGAVVGGLVGAMSTSERWTSVSRPQGLTIAPSGQGLRIGLTRSF